MTAGTGTHAAAPNNWTSCKPGGCLGSRQGGTAAGNDHVDTRERAEVGRPLSGRQAVGGGHHKHHRKDHERGSTRPAEERERKRNDCEDGRWRD